MPQQPLKNHPSGHLGEWATLWSAEEMLDGQHQRVDIPAHVRTTRHNIRCKNLSTEYLTWYQARDSVFLLFAFAVLSTSFFPVLLRHKVIFFWYTVSKFYLWFDNLRTAKYKTLMTGWASNIKHLIITHETKQREQKNYGLGWTLSWKPYFVSSIGQLVDFLWAELIFSVRRLWGK